MEALHGPVVPRSEPFVWTDQLTQTGKWTTFAAVATSILASAAFLLGAAILYFNSKTRHAVQRQSFLLLLAVQVAGITYAVAYMVLIYNLKPSPVCQPLVLINVFCDQFKNYVIMAIAINLHLVVVHNINTRHYLPWYLSSAFLATVAGILPSAVNGMWGWDPLSQACWITFTEPSTRTRWTIGTIYAPSFIASAVSLVAIATILWRLLAMDLATRRIFTHSRRRTSETAQSALFRCVALRVVWYPCILVVANTIGVSADMAVSRNGGITSMQNFRLWVVSAFFLAATPFFYALVAFGVDPAFSSAIREHILRYKSTMVLDRPAPSSIMFRQGVRTVSVELTLAHSEVARNQPSGTNGGEVEAPTSTWDKGIQDDGKDTLTDVPDLEGAQVQTTRHGVQAKTSSDVEEIQTRSLDVDAL